MTDGDDDGPREASLDTIQRELTAFARRARAAAARLHPELPLVSYTLLAHIDDQQGCRATDLAAHYLLDKSTVSRQIGGLERLGLVERRPDPDDHRVQVLHPTEAGSRVLAATQASRHAAYQERLKDWPADDLARFASYLLRYNAAGPGGA
ncbi:MarR family winged helix-turn-helix transcriptional regulator [Streptomyces sp. NPDC047981]|uniref:MarR family winged helix-turn-helix transcriptional regulator n=1 Tax=Streptomyces sp. NPDC047981 TaxID=3154610 RepID=UPI00343C865E